MDGVTLIETAAFNKLLDKVDKLESFIQEVVRERNLLLKPLMTVKEVCEYLDKGSTWIDQNKTKIGYTKVGGEIRFRRKDVEDYLASGYFREPVIKEHFKRYI